MNRLAQVAIATAWLPALLVCTIGAIAAEHLGLLEGTEEP